MTIKGIDGILIETHNWGKTVAFWLDLGYEVEFETDHNSGRLRHPGGSPYIFIAGRPQGDPLQVTLALLRMLRSSRLRTAAVCVFF
jgi:hypothetical protein